MKDRIHRAAAAMLLLVFLACASVGDATPQQTIDAFIAALDHGDAQIATLFTDDATVFFPMNDRRHLPPHVRIAT